MLDCGSDDGDAARPPWTLRWPRSERQRRRSESTVITAEKIESASASVEELQGALAVVQTGLEHAGEVAEVAEEVRRTGRWMVRLLILGLVIAVIVTVLSRRRRPEPRDATSS